MTIVFLIVSFILSTIIVNGAQRIFMKVLGIDTMFFRIKTKIIAIIVVAMVILTIFNGMFGFIPV